MAGRACAGAVLGARVADLTELWGRPFGRGFTVGGNRIAAIEPAGVCHSFSPSLSADAFAARTLPEQRCCPKPKLIIGAAGNALPVG